MEQGTALGIPGGETAMSRPPAFPDGEIGPRPSPAVTIPLGFPEGKRRSPASFPPPQRQRRCAIQPGVMRVAALPRVLATSGSLPRKGLCRSCTSEGAISKGGMGWGSRVQMKSPPGGNGHYPHNPQTQHALRSAVRNNRLGGCGPLAAHTRGNAWDGATPGFMAQHLRCRKGGTPDERGWGDRLEIPIRESQRRCAAASHLWQNPVGIPGRIVRPSPRPTGCDGLGLCFVLSSKGAAVLTPPRLYICSRVSMPRTSRPCFRTRAVKSQIARRLARDSGSALRTWQFS